MEIPLKIKVTGKRALLMNNPASMKRSGDNIKRPKIPTPEEESESKAYRMPDGQLYVKTEAIHGALLKACSGYKVGKLSAKPIIAAGINYYSEYCPLIDPDTGKPISTFEIDIRRAVVQGQGVLRARPKINKWSFYLEMTYDNELFSSPKIIIDMLTEAGRRVGIGDQRPGAPKTPGPFGTFLIEVCENGK